MIQWFKMSFVIFSCQWRKNAVVEHQKAKTQNAFPIAPAGVLSVTTFFKSMSLLDRRTSLHTTQWTAKPN